MRTIGLPSQDIKKFVLLFGVGSVEMTLRKWWYPVN